MWYVAVETGEFHILENSEEEHHEKGLSIHENDLSMVAACGVANGSSNCVRVLDLLHPMNSGCHGCTTSECTQSHPPLATYLGHTPGTFVQSNQWTSWSSVCMIGIRLAHTVHGHLHITLHLCPRAARVALPPLRQICVPGQQARRHHQYVLHSSFCKTQQRLSRSWLLTGTNLSWQCTCAGSGGTDTSAHKQLI